MNKVCEHCGVGYTSKQPASKFCREECQRKAYWQNRDKNKFELLCQECKTYYKGQDKRQKYCSRSCAARRNNIKQPKRGDKRKNLPSVCQYQPCSNILGYAQKSYCTKDCKNNESVRVWLSDGSAGNRKYNTATFVYEYMTEQCGGRCEGIDTRTGERCIEDRVKPNGVTILQLDHIDGNWQNNDRSNLRMLCPTCHVLTETYGAGNMGNGRAWRRLPPGQTYATL